MRCRLTIREPNIKLLETHETQGSWWISSMQRTLNVFYIIYIIYNKDTHPHCDDGKPML